MSGPISVESVQIALKMKELENAELRKRANCKAIFLPFLFFGVGAAVGFFVKVGVPVITKEWFSSEKGELAARWIMYIFALSIVFPILGCVITNSVNNVAVLKALKMPENEDTRAYPVAGNAVQRWWKDFSSADNLSINLCYYSIALLVAGFFCFVQYVSVRGIQELFAPLEHHVTEIVVSVSIIVGIAIASLGVIFSGALQTLLYHRQPTILPSSCFFMEKVQANVGDGVEAAVLQP